MRHCPTCGTRLVEQPPTVCPSCGAEHWRNAKPCGGALVVRAGRLLLVHRAVEPWRDRWDIPGGFCEHDEHPAETARRETREETGLDVVITGFLGLWVDRYGDGDHSDTTLNAYYHALPLTDAEAVAETDETNAAAWFGPDELPEPIAFPDHQGDVLAAWRVALARGLTTTPLLDRP